MTEGPYRGGKVHVLAEKCSTCIFRPGNKMHLQPGRVKEMVEGSLKESGAITCHQTLPYGEYEADPAVCRGFYDAYKDQHMLLRLAESMGIVEEDSPPTKKKVDE